MLSSVGVGPVVVGVSMELSLQHAPMDRFPSIGNVGVKLVVAQPGQALAPAPVGFDPASARRHIDHVAIEHGDADRRLFDEHANLRLAVLQRALRRFRVGDVATDSDHAHWAARFEIDVAASGDPALGPVISPADAVLGLVKPVAARIEGGAERGLDLGDVVGTGDAEHRLSVHHGFGGETEHPAKPVHVRRRILFDVEIESRDRVG